MADLKAFFSQAYLKQLDDGNFGLYRDVIVEEKNPRTGKVTKEKNGSVGPLMVFREVIREGEFIDMQSWHPTENRPLALVKLWDGREGPEDEKNIIE